MGKIIAVIEDTGERRVPLAGEKYTTAHRADERDVVGYIWSHAQTTTEYAILQITAVDGLSVDSLKIAERVELINLRRFRAEVIKANASFGKRGSGATDLEELREDVTRVASRLQMAASELGALRDDLLRSDPEPGLLELEEEAGEAAFQRILKGAFQDALPEPASPPPDVVKGAAVEPKVSRNRFETEEENPF